MNLRDSNSSKPKRTKTPFINMYVYPPLPIGAFGMGNTQQRYEKYFIFFYLIGKKTLTIGIYLFDSLYFGYFLKITA